MDDEFDKLYKETIVDPKAKAAEVKAIKESHSFFALNNDEFYAQRRRDYNDDRM